MKQINGYIVGMILLVSIISGSNSQRSLVDRLKALDKGIRQGLQLKKADSTPSNNNPLAESPELSSATSIKTEVQELPTSPQQQQLSPVSLEDPDGTNDVVRQLTETYEEEEEVRYAFFFPIIPGVYSCLSK